MSDYDELIEVMTRACARACGQNFDKFDRIGRAAWLRHQTAAVQAAEAAGFQFKRRSSANEGR